MAFLGLAMILLIVYGIEFLDGIIQKKNNKNIEEIHSRAYDWIDVHTDDPLLAVKRKAEIDTMVHDTVQSKGRSYDPPSLREIATEDFIRALHEILEDEMIEEENNIKDGDM